MYNVVATTRNLPVVVGIDGSRTHLHIVELAVAEAVRRRAPLLIVHVWPGRYGGSLRTRGAMPTEADGRHLLDMATQFALRIARGIGVDTELAAGSAANVLVQHSQTARLVVVGRRDGLLTQASWGSTAAYLAHHVACPLLVHRGAAPDQGPVVVGVSARGRQTATVASAYEAAALSGSRLVAVHVRSPVADANDPARDGVTVGSAADRQQAERDLGEALAGWTPAFPDVVVDRLVLREEDVVYTLGRASLRGRLLVAGAGPNGRLAELLYGSLAPASTHHAVCPVLLVPSGWRHPLSTSPTAGLTMAGGLN
jgi:nucleotide-binding universal stress UspA family protein